MRSLGVGPALALIQRPIGPAGFGLRLIPQQSVCKYVDVEAFWKRVLIPEIFFEDRSQLLMTSLGVVSEPTQVGHHMFLGAVGRKRELDNRLGFEPGRRSRLLEPLLERAAPMGSDGIDGSTALAIRPCFGLRPASRNESLRFGIQIALSPGPEEVKVALHLLGKLIGRPRPDREQPEDRV